VSRLRAGQGAAIVLAASLLAGSLGCHGYAALREGRYAEVEPETIHAAGSSGAEDLPDALAKLLGQRIEGSGGITEEQAIEAVISLGKIGQERHADTLQAILRGDPSADARYFAVEALGKVAPAKLKADVPRLLQAEKDPVVRKRLQEWTAP
jgi:HEAT repeat protein